MLNDATSFSHIYLKTGRTDMRQMMTKETISHNIDFIYNSFSKLLTMRYYYYSYHVKYCYKSFLKYMRMMLRLDLDVQCFFHQYNLHVPL